MSALAVVLVVVAVVGLVVVAMAVQSLIITLRSLRETVEDLRRETLPVVAELQRTVDAANGELARVDGLLDTAEEVSARVDATSKLTWLVLRNPLVKLASVSVATDRLSSRLRRSEGGDRGEVGRPGPYALPSPDEPRAERRRPRRRRAG